jgi:hypothetical protein
MNIINECSNIFISPRLFVAVIMFNGVIIARRLLQGKF